MLMLFTFGKERPNHLSTMRKLKGVVKETAKRERKQEFAKMRQQMHTIVLPTFAVIFLLICVYVYFKTRPAAMQYA
ncbi:unnamed protein product, partial [Brenthis ino]